MNTPVFEMELTRRQKQSLTLMAKGMPEKQIAAEMRVSISVVKEYKTFIFRKLGAVNSAHAVAIGKDRGLI